MTKFQSLLATGLLLAVGGAQAELITISGTGGVVDSSSATRDVTVGTSGLITDVNLTVDFSKCGGSATMEGCTSNLSGFTFNREIVFWLVHLSNTANIVDEFTFSGQSGAARVTQTYDDEAGTAVGGNSLQNGTFSPVGLLSLFDGLDSAGIWTFGFQDTVGSDPLVVHSWTLNITTADATAVPEPGTLALFGLGLLGLGVTRRRKSL